MNKKDVTVLIGKLKRISADINDIISELEGPAPEAAGSTVKEMTVEEVRKILAEKARSGFRAEVRSILAAHGAKQLSDITDPAVFAAIAAEAEVIGSA